MKRHWTCLAVAALAMGGLSFSAAAQEVAEEGAPAAGAEAETGAIAAPVGAVGVEAEDLANIRDILSSASEAAVTEGGFDDLLERIYAVDRERIGELGETELLDYEEHVKIFRENWRARYNQEFDIALEELVFDQNFATVVGEDLDRAVVAAEAGQAERIEEVEVEIETTEREVEAEREFGQPETADVERPEQTATVRIAQAHGLPETTVQMVKDDGDWRIDVPDLMTAQQLKANLTQQIALMNEQTVQWPADMLEAKRYVAHHVLTATSGQGLQAEQANPQQPGQSAEPAPGAMPR